MDDVYAMRPQPPQRTNFGESAFANSTQTGNAPSDWSPIVSREQARQAQPGSGLDDLDERKDPDIGDNGSRERRRKDDAKWFNAAELDRMDCDVPYLINDVLAEGQLGVIAGPRKSFKTTAAAAAAVAVATGTPFLREFTVPQRRRVAFVSGESGRRKLQKTCRGVAKAAGTGLEEIGDWLDFRFDMPCLLHAGGTAELQRRLSQGDYGLLILDPWYLAIRNIDDASSKYKVGDVLYRLEEAAPQAGVTILIVDHLKIRDFTRKYTMPDPDEVVVGVGEKMRQWCLLSPREKFNPATGEARLWLNVGGSEGHGSEWALDVYDGVSGKCRGQDWRTRLRPAEDVAEERQQAKAEREANKAESITSQLAERIFAEVRNLPDVRDRGETRTAILRAAKIDKDNRHLDDAFQKLIDDGRIEECSFMKGGRHQQGYRLLS